MICSNCGYPKDIHSPFDRALLCPQTEGVFTRSLERFDYTIVGKNADGKSFTENGVSLKADKTRVHTRIVELLEAGCTGLSLGIGTNVKFKEK